MQLFDTYVQKLKYKVLREVARHAYEDNLQDCYLDIPKLISPAPRANCAAASTRSAPLWPSV